MIPLNLMTSNVLKCFRYFKLKQKQATLTLNTTTYTSVASEYSMEEQ